MCVLFLRGASFCLSALLLLALGAQPLGAYSAWWPAVLIGIACAGHQAWSANIYSVVGDMFPKSTIGTLTGIAQFAAGLGSFMVNKSAGKLFTFAADKGEIFSFCGFTGKEAGYFIMFSYCAVAYIIGWLCMKILVPKYKKVEI
jgi:ACS family hexuronate transporter-like MFS transporter